MSVIILTGASRGIGAAIAEVLLKDTTHKLVAISRSEPQLKELQQKYGEDRVVYVAGDVSDENTSIKAIEAALDKFGKIDSIIANAGVLDPVDSVANSDISRWKKLFDVNFFSVVDLVTRAIPALRTSKGNVIIVSSGASTSAYHGWGAYGSSKAAINHFAASVAEEEKDISAISVAPGVVDTQMQQDIREVFIDNMIASQSKKFLDLKSEGKLLDPVVPATIYVNLATRGFGKELNGGYFRYNDVLLESYTK